MTAIGKALEPAYRSKLERDYAAVLAQRHAAGEVRWWAYEDVALRLAHDCRLHVDFFVQLADLTLEAHEVKGPHRWEDSIVKLRAAAAKFPLTFRLVTRSKEGEWKIEEVGAPRTGVPKSVERPAPRRRKTIPAEALASPMEPGMVLVGGKEVARIGKPRATEEDTQAWRPGDQIPEGYVLMNGRKVRMSVSDALNIGIKKKGA